MTELIFQKGGIYDNLVYGTSMDDIFIVLSLITGIVEVAKAFNHTKDNDENETENKEEK